MPRQFKKVDYEKPGQQPVTIDDVLPADHLARFIVNVVAMLSLSAIYGQYGAVGLLRVSFLHPRRLTDEQALCWVYEGRHYKKLATPVAYHQQLLADFLTDFWNFYHQLQRYRASPSLAQAQHLSYQFDTLFSTVTSYAALDKRIAKTKARKDKLLMVLKYPHIPLHNNPAELGARHRVRKRDVSFGPRTQNGVAAWDTFMTLAATANKLGVSFFAYIYDRVSIEKIPILRLV